MNYLTRADLFTLEDYARRREDFRREVMEHKKHRQVPVGPNATLYFEDRLTVQYQIQEMLRVERIFESDAINEELAAYNPLVPSGENLKATFMIEYPGERERQHWLAKLKGIERCIWVQVGEHEPVYAIADEDLERENDEKTSAVHFLRFELGATGAQALAAGTGLSIGVEHSHYSHRVGSLPPQVRDSLARDVAC